MAAGLALLVAALVALFAPAAASAESYVVNDLGDAADAAVGSEGCDSVAGGAKQCTLRAAIQESNNSTGVKDAIGFDATVFEGKVVDTITLGPSFPIITDPVTIDGDGAGQCTTEAAAIKGPCAAVTGPSGGFGLVVEADKVTIEGLAVTGALIGINVINASEEFVARDNWVGVKLDGTAGANNTGLFLDPNSNKAAIGGTAATDRNVFAGNNLEGLDIEGASGAVVRGNYFGVAPNGAAVLANAKNIEVTDSTSGGGFKAVDNEIGGGVSPAQAATAVCDGGCNVISGSASAGIDMEGAGGNEAPPSGPTTIQGNYLGLNAAGTAALPNTTSGILVGGADEALIGGSGEGEGNHINGGTFGVLADEGANDLVIDDNLIGLNFAGTATLSPPSTEGIFDGSSGVVAIAKAAEITDNRISMLGGIAIEQHSTGALISGNDIGRGAGGQSLSGGSIGIKLHGDNSLLGNTIEANVIENATENGVLVENDNNELVGNVIEGAGAAGIRIQSALPATGNLIGGDTEQEENAISDSGGDAIEVVDDEDDDTQIKRNFGDSNSGLFIDLGADGAGNKGEGPNNGIQPPTVSSATEKGASGTALPKATVRVFRKATASPGELQSFLGKATADGEGKWSLTYSSQIPGGTNIGATQSEIEGTSELAFAVTSTIVIDGGCGFTGGPQCEGKKDGGAGGADQDKDKNKGKEKGKGKDKKAPETTIVKGPRARTHKRTAKFKFVSSEAGSTFQCKLDRRKFKPCSSPKKYKRLKPGKHVFEVRAIDAAGNKDKTPAKRKFRVLE
jgi:hypothetical protein